MGDYFRITPDERGLNYDKFLATYGAITQADKAYTSHNTTRLNIEETIQKILTTDYVNKQLEDWSK